MRLNGTKQKSFNYFIFFIFICERIQMEYIYKVIQTTKNPMAFTVEGTEKLIEITTKKAYLKTDLDHFEARKGDKLILFEWEMEGKLQTQIYDYDGNYLGNLLFMDTFFYDGVEPVTRICKV